MIKQGVRRPDKTVVFEFPDKDIAKRFFAALEAQPLFSQL